jgi:pyrroline-5-carboxylate reductase
MMRTQRIGFIGGGNMARALTGGLISSGREAAAIMVSDPDAERREALASQLGVQCTASNGEVAATADVVVLAVKPQQLQAVATEIAADLRERSPLVVSIAAGVRLADLDRWLGGGLPIVRVMPNTPALVGSGAAGLFANTLVDDRQRDTAESILRAVGVTAWLDSEDQLDLVTALSGSGPAYFLLVMEALEQAATDQGLAPETARLLTLETAFGSAKLALESTEAPAVLRQRVTSPGGTTERALEVLETGGIRALMRDAVAAAAARSRELAAMLGED